MLPISIWRTEWSRYGKENSERPVCSQLRIAPKHGSPITPRNGIDFSELLQLRSSFQIGVSVSPTAALDITSPWSASRSDCGHRKSSTDMDVGPVFMIYVTIPSSGLSPVIVCQALFPRNLARNTRHSPRNALQRDDAAHPDSILSFFR